ncbi:HU family DNA-binding protein [Ezakiella massiliensis]|uniref:HU family DNA-binding protein n=1 Tax=Ezakiella massiliensis TaxID=1852374 RepID=UPI00094F1869|nr:HU family DNA-binding protein [Ezakiella massiliensis]
MNKSELVAAIAEKTEMTKKDSERALNATIESITEALSSGDKVQLIGFGTFEVRERKAREGRNPRNPEEVIKIPATKAPAFKAGKALKESVNTKKKSKKK